MNLSRRDFLAASATAVALGTQPVAAEPKAKKLVLIAGTPSHPPGMHEHNAGVQLFHQCLKGINGLEVSFVLNGYPKDDSILDTADGILCYADGGKGHPLIQGERLARLGKLLEKGVGLFCLHFGVEVPKGPAGDTFRDWIGGCYEHEFSCNPMWKADFTELPKHPITSGVKPFAIHDEWYFNMRFRPEMKGVTPILTATPTDATRDGPYVYPKGPYKHIQEAKGRAEHLMWATDRKGGGRGVGFTGGHFHKNWADDNFRKLVLNALLWISKVDVPADGMASTLTDEDMQKNLDPKGKK
ncbi:MAG: ThuA domain-containing protein [Planctomycetes bacterium]|nr:ThuA domain-containing protein [Planctomycetota bacterium]